MDQTQDGGPWDVEQIEARLIAAFRALPSHPVFSNSNGVRPLLDQGNAGPFEALDWAARYVPDRVERLMLLTWARCRATRESVRERYRALGWSRTKAERLRRRALARIAAKLSGEAGA